MTGTPRALVRRILATMACAAVIAVAPASDGQPAGAAAVEPVPMSAPWQAFEPRDRFEERLPEGWYARIRTSEGEILALLHPEQAPQSVAWFAGLAEARLPWTDVVTGEIQRTHYYDGLLVHRAEAGSRFESGDPHGTGQGAPAIYVPFVRGAMDFAVGWRIGNTRASLGRINAAQFFVTATPIPSLSTMHPCFGTVLQGKEVVFRITSVKTYSNGRPIEPVTIESIRIRRKGDPPDLVEPEPYVPEIIELKPREELIRR